MAITRVVMINIIIVGYWQVVARGLIREEGRRATSDRRDRARQFSHPPSGNANDSSRAESAEKRTINTHAAALPVPPTEYRRTATEAEHSSEVEMWKRSSQKQK